jgi:leucyl-tRNA synthetase
VRMYLAFIGPYNEVGAYPWDPNGTLGMRRFLERVWRMSDKIGEGILSAQTKTLLEETKRGVAEDIERLKFNTAISKLMVMLNALEKEERVPRDVLRAYLVMLAPFAPHITEELFHTALGENGSVHEETWPEFDERKLRNKTVTVVIQINGKVRGSIEVPSDTDKEALERRAREAVAEKLQGKAVARAVVVPGRLVNFVVTEG